jgi:lysozyme
MSTMTQRLLDHIKVAEGFRAKPYTCPAGKLTIGYGFNIEDRGIPEEVAEFWLAHELAETKMELWRSGFGTNISPARLHVLYDMAYNMGVPRLRQFKKMFAALSVHDYETASLEMLDSKWARQVGNRAKKLSEIMRKGEWPEV